MYTNIITLLARLDEEQSQYIEKYGRRYQFYDELKKFFIEYFSESKDEARPDPRQGQRGGNPPDS